MIGVIPGCNVVGCGPAFDPNAGIRIPARSSRSRSDTHGVESHRAFLQSLTSRITTPGWDGWTIPLAKRQITARYEFDRFTKAPVFNPQLLVAYTRRHFLDRRAECFAP